MNLINKKLSQEDNNRNKLESIEVPCQGGCGELFIVPSGYVGCPFCNNCRKPKTYTLGTEDFNYNEL